MDKTRDVPSTGAVVSDSDIGEWVTPREISPEWRAEMDRALWAAAGSQCTALQM